MREAADDTVAGATATDPAQRVLACLQHIAHCLPAQAPLRDFVHHNTLHAFQHLPFSDALAAAARLTGARPWLPEERCRELFRQGRIDADDLAAALRQLPAARSDATLFVADGRAWCRGEVLQVALLPPGHDDPACRPALAVRRAIGRRTAAAGPRSAGAAAPARRRRRGRQRRSGTGRGAVGHRLRPERQRTGDGDRETGGGPVATAAGPARRRLGAGQPPGPPQRRGCRRDPAADADPPSRRASRPGSRRLEESAADAGFLRRLASQRRQRLGLGAGRVRRRPAADPAVARRPAAGDRRRTAGPRHRGRTLVRLPAATGDGTARLGGHVPLAGKPAAGGRATGQPGRPAGRAADPRSPLRRAAAAPGLGIADADRGARQAFSRAPAGAAAAARLRQPQPAGRDAGKHPATTAGAGGRQQPRLDAARRRHARVGSHRRSGRNRPPARPGRCSSSHSGSASADARCTSWRQMARRPCSPVPPR
jgi:hypothetical protein